MTFEEAWPQIVRYESGGRNVRQGVVDPSISSASGLAQITDTNLQHYGPTIGIDTGKYKSVMDLPADQQKKLAEVMFNEQGLSPWAPYNPRLANAVGWTGPIDPRGWGGGGARTHGGLGAPAGLPVDAGGGDIIQAQYRPPGGGGMGASPEMPPPQHGNFYGIMDSPWMALVAAGARMAQTPGGLGAGLAAGMEAGLKYGQAQEGVETKQEAADIRGQYYTQQAAHQHELAEISRSRAEETARFHDLQQARYAESEDLKRQIAQAGMDKTYSGIMYQTQMLDLRQRQGDVTEADRAARRMLEEQKLELERAMARSSQVSGQKDGIPGTYIIRPGATQAEIDAAPFIPAGPKGGVGLTDAEVIKAATTAAANDYSVDKDGKTPLPYSTKLDNAIRAIQAQQEALARARRPGAAGPAAPAAAAPQPPAGSPTGTSLARDGKWYAPDPNNPGKYLRVGD